MRLRKRPWTGALTVSAIALLAASGGRAQEALPKAPPPFAGKIDADRDKSTPDWRQQAKARPGAPNVLLVLLDDVGFGATSITGGPVKAPALEKLAAEGLRYNSFHVNSLCSPTRASLLSGRNNHEIGFGTVIEGATGYPGYNASWPKSAASVAEVLKDNGYSTAAFGKWHNTPAWEAGPTGPFEHWPTSLGFEYWYGFQGGADNQWEPRLFRNTVAAEPSATPASGYHLTTDLANDAIKWLHQHDAVTPDKPFFLYFATGATHTPHHVPQVWIDKHKGEFDQGWDKLREQTFARQKAQGLIPANAELTSRPAELPAWDSLSPEQKKLLAHQAEVYAGFLEHTDYEIGRVLQAIRDEGQGDNTLVLYIVGDNGASAEGGLEGTDIRTIEGKPETLENRAKIATELGSDLYFNHYAAGWAWGLDAPFQWTKQVASHLGGTTDPLVVSWPAKIKDHGAIRSQFQHVTDIAPTIYELAGITPPKTVDGVEQLPLEGKSLAASFFDAKAPSTHPVQYFEMVGNRGIYKDGWWAGARHLLPWQRDAWETAEIGQHPWELYNLNEDYSQAHDLAAKNPEKLKELVELFDSEARRNNVYPLAPHKGTQPLASPERGHVVLRDGVERVPVRLAPNVRGRSHTITAGIEIPSGGAEGVIVAEGGREGGFALYVKQGKVVYEVTAAQHQVVRIVGSEPLPTGKSEITVEVTVDKPEQAPGKALLSINGKPAGEGGWGNFANTFRETLDVGKDLGTPVSPAYESPFAFTGTIGTVAFDLK
ncbi:arylsulfatase [Rhodoblastus sphagnicola]|uniref:Arylsulfatase n=1 Tax=Rhodoblastus sphagnicola TaxID=333368 RepID=A0A2S6N6U5_9HYPH|nr:arylsulfatase [Rhodoblastus sphagnicola]MBB4200986.1 arylsulfatase [Rhodoblastus sphagnicola]PPQ30328.1 arylsulfatase [Rhodoblastus sphagnicola]